MNNNNTLYKDSPLGKIPGDWEVSNVEKCFFILDNIRKPLNDNERKKMRGDIPYYGANGIVDYVSGFIFNDELILIAEDGGYFDEYTTRPIAYIINGKSWVNNHAHVLKAKDGYHQKYLFYCLEHKNILICLNGGTRAKLNKADLEKLPIQIPPLPEQKAIANILSLMDSAINTNNQLILKKKLQKKWLMHQLLTGRRRIKKFTKSELSQKTNIGELPVDWKIDSIKHILNPVKKSFIPKQDEEYQQIGIRSHAKGLFYKEKVTGAALGDKSVFKIEPDCFIVNIVFAWEHAIAKTSEKEIGMIASHRFPMYKPKEGVLDLDFLLYYFKSLRGKHLLGLASPGGAGRNKTLGQSEFVKLLLPVPSFEEQTAIAHILEAADNQIKLLRAKTEKLREQKKGLMQVLLTGKKRLTV